MKDANFESTRQAYNELFNLINNLTCSCDGCKIIKEFAQSTLGTAALAEKYENKLAYIMCAFLLGSLYNNDEEKAFNYMCELIGKLTGALK